MALTVSKMDLIKKCSVPLIEWLTRVLEREKVMSRKVFFSFHYGRDSWRAAQVRNCGITKEKNARGYIDAAAWEEVKKKGDKAVKDWIDSQLKGTSVTAVLIGKETSERKYVQYEIKQSYKKGNGIIGIYIHDLESQNKEVDSQGKNPFEICMIDRYGKEMPLPNRYKVYNWTKDDGYNNFSKWIEAAATQSR